MTYVGAFRHLYSPQAFTLTRRVVASQNQTTGARIAASQTTATIYGSLDPLTEKDLGTVPVQFVEEGRAWFHTEESYGVEVQDLITDPETDQVYRITQQYNTAPLVRRVIGAGADMVTFVVELTREG